MRGLVVPEIVDSISTRHPTYICGYGEIGSRAGFRYQWRNPWGFESLYPHQFLYGPVAQLEEHPTLNRQVVGSNPSWSTIFKGEV